MVHICIFITVIYQASAKPVVPRSPLCSLINYSAFEAFAGFPISLECRNCCEPFCDFRLVAAIRHVALLNHFKISLFYSHSNGSVWFYAFRAFHTPRVCFRPT